MEQEPPSPLCTFGDLAVGEYYIPFTENWRDYRYHHEGAVNVRRKYSEGSGTDRLGRWLEWPDNRVIRVRP